MKDGIISEFTQGVRNHTDRLLPDYIPALLETRPTKRVPPYGEKTLTADSAAVFLPALITPEQQFRLHNLVSELSEGSFRWREAAGTPEDGNRHVHDFVIAKDASAAQLFYIDPEYAMGESRNKRLFRFPRRGDLRPQVNVLYGLELTPDNTITRISALRYRASAIPANQVHMNKPAEQLGLAQAMVQSGELPGILQGKENEITFHLDYRQMAEDHRVSVRARAAQDDNSVEQRLESLANGQPLSSNDPVEGLYSYFDDDYFHATYVLTLQLEDFLRQLLAVFGGQTTVAEAGAFREKTLGSILTELKPYVSEPVYHYISWVMEEYRGFNLRNNIAHGFFKKKHASPVYSTAILHIFCLLIANTKLSVKEQK